MANDIKSYLWNTLTADVSGNVAITATSFPIKGEVLKVAWKSGNFAANGSLHVIVSGNSYEPNELLIGVNQCSGDRMLYPRVIVCDSGGSAIPAGDNRAGCFEVNNKVFLWGSGCGASKSGASLTLFYR